MRTADDQTSTSAQLPELIFLRQFCRVSFLTPGFPSQIPGFLLKSRVSFLTPTIWIYTVPGAAVPPSPHICTVPSTYTPTAPIRYSIYHLSAAFHHLLIRPSRNSLANKPNINPGSRATYPEESDRRTACQKWLRQLPGWWPPQPATTHQEMLWLSNINTGTWLAAWLMAAATCNNTPGSAVLLLCNINVHTVSWAWVAQNNKIFPR